MGFFTLEKPHNVFEVIDKSGGFMTNEYFPCEFLKDNLGMQNNLFESSSSLGVKCFLFSENSRVPKISKSAYQGRAPAFKFSLKEGKANTYKGYLQNISSS